MKISESELDTERFGVRSGKVQLNGEDDLGEIDSWCALHRIQFLIARCLSNDVNLVQKMEKNGFFLTDTLIYYRNKKITYKEHILADGYSWRVANESDGDEVEKLASDTFSGYAGHYHADSSLDKIDSDAVYSSWAGNSCRDRNIADKVLLIIYQNKIVAFATLKKIEEYMVEGVLFGVCPKHQGKSLYNSLMLLAQNWACQNNFTQMTVSTQLTNLAVQKIWCRQDFEPFKSFYTLHKWFAK